MTTETIHDAMKSRRFAEAVSGGQVRAITHDYAIVFHPSASYYNRGRNTVSSHIDIVFRAFDSWSGKECKSLRFADDMRPTANAIKKASELAEEILKTVKAAEEYVAKVGPGVALFVGENGTLKDGSGTSVVFHSDHSRTDLIKRINNNNFVTTTPEYEEQIAEESRRQQQMQRDQAVSEWMAAYEAADAETRRAMVQDSIVIKAAK